MTSTASPRALLLTGPYGVGKSALVAELSGLLEGRVRFAAIDLDWLAWYDDGVTPGHSPAAFEMLLRNLRAVVANYREAGVVLFLLAGAILDEHSHRQLVQALAMPLHVVAVTAPLTEIERRLTSDPTSGRLDDLGEARAWIESGARLGFEHDDLVVNVGPLRAVAGRIAARWLDVPATRGS